MSRAASVLLLCCLTLTVSAAQGEWPPGEPVALPAPAVSDDFNRAWVFAEDGTPSQEGDEQNALFEQAGRLIVDGIAFRADAGRLVRVPGQAEPWLLLGPQRRADGLECARLVHVARKTGLCRWLDVVANPGEQRRAVALRWQYQFNWSPRAIDWRSDERRQVVGAVVAFGSRRVPAIGLWWGAGVRATLRDSATDGALEAVAECAPGEAVAVLHALVIRPNADEATRVLAQLGAETLGAGTPWLGDLRVLNLPAGGDVLAGLRAPGIDGLHLLAGGRLRGTLMTPTFTVASDFGSLSVPRAELSGIIRRGDGRWAVHLADGTCLAGAVGPDHLSLALPTGDQVDVALSDLRVIAPRTATTTRRLAPAAWELLTTDHQRLRLTELRAPTTWNTALGPLAVPVDHLLAVEAVAGGPLRLSLAGGGGMHAFTAGPAVAGVVTGGGAISLPLTRLRSLRSLRRIAPAPAVDAEAVVVTLVNGDTLTGRLAAPLAIAAAGRALAVRGEHLRSAAIDPATAQTEVHFADGAYVAGVLATAIELTLPWGAGLRLEPHQLTSLAATGDGERRRQELEVAAMLRDLSGGDETKAQAARAWLAARKVALKDVLVRAYDAGDLPPATRRTLGLIIGREF